MRYHGGISTKHGRNSFRYRDIDWGYECNTQLHIVTNYLTLFKVNSQSVFLV